jgi:hypothetical protein
MEGFPSAEASQETVFTSLETILADAEWHEGMDGGSLFVLGSGKKYRFRIRNWSYGPGFTERSWRKFTLGRLREERRQVHISVPEGQNSEGWAAVTTHFYVYPGTGYLKVKQHVGGYGVDYQSAVKFFETQSQYRGLEDASWAEQWHALADICREYALLKQQAALPNL